jgi:GT2 family glycosyltransferase
VIRLSVVIVNYNVKYFLEQCLHAALRASEKIPTEIFVVDNNSVDGSVAMVREKFPQVTLIANAENVGFSRANNQAMTIAKGEYVLLLNPDTVVQEDTFTRCLEFMDSHVDAGCLGVKMIDGKGRFLPESKRALPTPEVAFYKIFGLSWLFPHSKRFGKYHLTYLDKNQTHPVDILCGAFMLMRKDALDKSGLLDETFFMYGEDIDLSYRIIKAGYQNYYFAGTTIIHYKGESTKKGSVNYVVIFYNAMLIFARKHFSKRNAALYTLLIQLAIYLRASLAIVRRFVTRLAFPVLDALLLIAGFFLLSKFWGKWWFGNLDFYPESFSRSLVPFCTAIWLFCIYLTGGYEKKQRLIEIFKGIGVGALVNLVIYALLPINFRFSRAVLLLVGAWAFVLLPLLRLLLHRMQWLGVSLSDFRKKRVLICAGKEESLRIGTFLSQLPESPEIAGYVSFKMTDSAFFLGSMDQLEEMVRINNVDEIIFSATDLSSQVIVETMLKYSNLVEEYKIAPPGSATIIGSNSINTSGELYLIDCNAISKESNRRYKRVVDVVISFLLLITCILWSWFIPKSLNAIGNCFRVLWGDYTWVGYYKSGISAQLPSLKKCILYPGDASSHQISDGEAQQRINFIYARDYKPYNDIVIIWRALKFIGR